MRFIVESYVSASRGDVDDLAARARAAAVQLGDEGAPLRYVEAIFVPEDEMCLLIFDADSAALAGEASRRAGIPFERVVEAQGEDMS